MSRRGTMSSEAIRFALADSIAFLDANDWDRVSAGSSLFLSRRFLRLLEQNLPDNLTKHYALAYVGGRPVAAIVAQSLDIRVADLSSWRPKEEGQGFGTPWGRLRYAPSPAGISDSCCSGRTSRGCRSTGRRNKQTSPSFGRRWRPACRANGTVS